MRTTYSPQWARAIDSSPNGRRTMQASTRPCALFTKGNKGSWTTGITAPMINTHRDGTPDEAVRYARRPMHDMPDDTVKIIRHARNTLLCPTCHIERARSHATCETCS